jgi:hypothetical protein
MPCLLSSLLLLGCGPMKTDAKVVERRLTSTIPLQSTPVQVLGYLNSEKIEHTQYVKDTTQGNSIKAMVRDKSRWGIVKTNYSVIFRFDDQDRLIGYDVRPAYTGP